MLGTNTPPNIYELLHTVELRCCIQLCFLEEDSEGLRGVTITKDLVIESSKAITTNRLLILPILDQIRFLTNTMIRFMIISMFPLSKKTFVFKPYIPNFMGAVDHFFPHVGGKPVLDGLQKSLNMIDSDMEATRMTLYRFGNVSSSLIWYVMARGEAKGRIKKGGRVWELAFGSGFKCCSIVWRANRTIDHDEHLSNPRRNEIDEFPLKLDCFKDKLYFD